MSLVRKNVEINVLFILTFFHVCGHHEYSNHRLVFGVSSNFLLEKKIYHKTHICNLCGL